jgi:hypothetical protein
VRLLWKTFQLFLIFLAIAVAPVYLSSKMNGMAQETAAPSEQQPEEVEADEAEEIRSELPKPRPPESNNEPVELNATEQEYEEVIQQQIVSDLIKYIEFAPDLRWDEVPAEEYREGDLKACHHACGTYLQSIMEDKFRYALNNFEVETSGLTSGECACKLRYNSHHKFGQQQCELNIVPLSQLEEYVLGLDNIVRRYRERSE